MQQQLTLAVQLNHELTFEAFCFQGNEWLQTLSQSWLQDASGQLLYLWGACGSGKSHFLQAMCHAVGPTQQASYLPLSLFREGDPGCLEGLETQDLICLDDLDQVIGNRAWEEALFHCYNRIKDAAKAHLIVSAQRTTHALTFQLPDLQSRLQSGITYKLHELDEASKISVLMAHAQRRGFILPESVAQFLLCHAQRSMHDLHALLETLDLASLQAKRRVTLPFVKQVLGL